MNQEIQQEEIVICPNCGYKIFRWSDEDYFKAACGHEICTKCSRLHFKNCKYWERYY